MKVRKISDKELFIRCSIALVVVTVLFFTVGKDAVYALASGFAIGWTAIFAGRF